MATSSSFAEGMPPRFNNAAVQARYTMAAAKNKWEEQGFLLDVSLENYGLEPIIYKRLSDLGWFRFAQQPARPNLNWVLEFYANNASGEDTISIRGRNVPANSATINSTLSLPNDSPSIYALIDVLEDEDFETIKDQLYEAGTEWNVKGKNPKTISRPHLQLEAKLWNTFVKRAAVPTSPGDKYAAEKSSWTRKEYMRKMEAADATPIQMAMPTPTVSKQAKPEVPTGIPPSLEATPQATPAASHAPTPATTPATQDIRQSTPDSPLGSTPTTPPSPPPARSKEAVPIHILQLRSQLQQIEARKLQHMEETKVFQNSFISFLCFQFPATAAYFHNQPTTTQPANFSAATLPKSTPVQSEGAGNTQKVDLSSDDENNIFDWHTPMEHQRPTCPTPYMVEVPGSSTIQKSLPSAPVAQEVAPQPTTSPVPTTQRRSKRPAIRVMFSDCSSSPYPTVQPPAKRQRRYHVITVDSDDDSSAGVTVHHPEQSADPSLSRTI
ncbi:hypothetical protein V6N11_056158 [Hibiscus sabdariffa]|uniref:Putative plant transposon protein domain-containing protein n=1 Tax=Hibiscus sabdariffa TaxID=183260 RepID=A0ABR2T2Z3_9ROSI